MMTESLKALDYVLSDNSILVLAAMDLPSVTPSAYSNSPPKATPRAMTLILTGKSLRTFVR